MTHACNTIIAGNSPFLVMSHHESVCAGGKMLGQLGGIEIQIPSLIQETKAVVVRERDCCVTAPGVSYVRLFAHFPALALSRTPTQTLEHSSGCVQA